MLSAVALGVALALSGNVHAVESADAAVVQQQVMDFDIPAQPLDRAALAFAEQAGIQVFFDSERLQGLAAPAVKGRYTVDEGIRQLLRGAPVSYRFSGARQITLSRQVSTDAAAIELHDITISGASPNDWVYQEPRSVSVITREDIDRRPPRHAADMLEQTSGVYSSVSQQDPALSVNIRGIQDFGRINMNIDGVRQNYQKTGYGQRNGQMYIDPDLLSSVTIDKGASNVMGSAGTLGGVATFSTANASDFLSDEKEYGGRVRLGGGNNGTNFIGSGIFAAGNETADILIGVSRRSFGDYRSGSHGDIGSWSRVETGGGVVTGYEKVFADLLKGGKISQSGYRMESGLAKFGLNLPGNQRLQLGYMRTETDTENAGVLTTVVNSANPLEQVLGWNNPSDSNITAQHVTLDYSLRPDDQHWLDLKLKLYYADTENDTQHHGSSPGVWPITPAYEDRTRLKTYGFQAHNSSHLWQQEKHELIADYGTEIFYDTVSSSSTDRNSLAAGATPEGDRTISSVFTNFNYSYSDWLVLQAGLRYDHYILKGDASMNIQVVNPIYTEANPCTANRQSGCPNLILDDVMSWDIDESAGKLSPSLFVGVKPGLDWLQLFASYGLAWRPPAVTEVFASGSARASDYTLYPNPLLDAERSKSWELGFNIVKSGLFAAEDQLAAKVAYFNTSVDGYISMVANQKQPGYRRLSLGHSVFQNNIKDSRFRGIEYLLSYDVGFAYGVANFTQMLGRNEFCYPTAWLGGITNVGGSAGNWYGTSAGDGVTSCMNEALFSSSSFLPGARGSVTLGGRAIDRKLDIGLTMRFAPGYQDKSVASNTPYQADWPKYQVFDFYASYPVTKSFIVRGSVENLTDEVYLVSYGEFMGYTPSRGRTVQASIEYNF